MGLQGRERCVHDFAVVIGPLTLHAHKAGTKHGRFSPDQYRNRRAQSAVIWSASRMEGELHPADIVRPEAYWLSRINVTASKMSLHFLVSSLLGTATGYTVSWVPYHANTTRCDHPF